MQELKDFMRYVHIAPNEYIDKLKIVVLDSSKSSKFSKHCIVKIPFTLFENNYYCGAFIRRFQIHIINKYGPKESNPFFVRPENHDKQSR